MEKSLFEQMDGTYTQVGDYMLPNLTIHEEEQKPIGHLGTAARKVLKAKSQSSLYEFTDKRQTE